MTNSPQESSGSAIPTARVGGRPRGTAVAAALVTVVVAGFGGAVGWIWAEVAPRVMLVKDERGLLYADTEPEQAMAGDGWFALLGAVTGVVFAVGVWVVGRRYRGATVMAGLVLGSLIGAALAWWVGRMIGQAQFDQLRATTAMGGRLGAPLGLRITDLDPNRWWQLWPTGVAAVQALAAAIVYTLLAGFSTSPDLRPQPQSAVSGYLPDVVVSAAEPPAGTGPTAPATVAAPVRAPDPRDLDGG